jgi:hypothetical protein
MTEPIPTRWSHLIGYNGVGSLVRAGDWLYVVKDIRSWVDRETRPAGKSIPYVELLKMTLGVEKDLRQPPMAMENQNGKVEGSCIPAWRFPSWMRCPKCHLLHWLPWRNQGIDRCDALRCHCGHRGLQQVTWVLVHDAGGLYDVPWHNLAHQSSENRCERGDMQPYLHLIQDRTTLRWSVHCARCRAAEVLRRGRKFPVSDPTQQPWDQSDPSRRPGGGLPNQEPAVILEVTDGNLYFPMAKGGLVIPPESRVARGSVLDRLYCDREARDKLTRYRSPHNREVEIRGLAASFNTTIADVKSALVEIDNGWPLYREQLTPGDLLVKEYHALTTPIPSLSDHEDFVPRHRTRDWQAFSASCAPDSMARRVAGIVDQLVAVTRLREVRVFMGFSRGARSAADGLQPDQGISAAKPSTPALIPPDLDGSCDWLPAVEYFGEGLFFTLANTAVERWARQPGLRARSDKLQARLAQTGLRFPLDPPLPLMPRFVLLHTLAHLLIRQLESQAGYSAASIRERIYCAEGPGSMAGILVYVAVPDIVGSLGGIAELAEPKRFLRLLTSVFEHADWCSLDPVCAEHEGQGPGLLNHAACHACALIPEPSCTFGNVLLDRTFIAGDRKDRIKPLLAFSRED